MSFNVEVRKKQLENLEQYITSSKDKVESILGYLGWTAKKVLENEDRTICPINSGHTVQLEKVVPHVERCRLKSSGYRLDEAFLSEPLHDPKSSVSLDNNQKIQVLNQARSANPRFIAAWKGYEPDPRTSDRLFSTFSADERLALYNHCVQHTEGPPVPPELDMYVMTNVVFMILMSFIFSNIPDEKRDDRPLTREEELLRERNAKRRRIKYKSVHTGRNKSYTEVIREVLQNQMEQYQEYIASTCPVLDEEIEQINNQKEKHEYPFNAYINYEQHSQKSYDDNGSIRNDSLEISRPSSSTGRHSSHSDRSRDRHYHSSTKRRNKTEHSSRTHDRRNDHYRKFHDKSRDRANHEKLHAREKYEKSNKHSSNEKREPSKERQYKIYKEKERTSSRHQDFRNGHARDRDKHRKLGRRH